MKRSDAERSILKKDLSRHETALNKLTLKVEESKKELKLKKKEVEKIRAKVNSTFIASHASKSKVTKRKKATATN